MFSSFSPRFACWICLSLLLLAAAGAARADGASDPATLCGTLQCDPAKAAAHYKLGFRLAVLEVGWNRYEPQADHRNAAYIAELQQKLQTFRAAGMRVVLDLGMQYPPQWIFALPNSRYVNQQGDAFAEPAAGMNGVNAVFNQALRERQAAYVRRVFTDLGADFYAVRLGWGWYSELNYPRHRYNGRENCYWAFDAVAQGKAPGLPPGMRPCPVPGWIPGTPSPEHRSAAQFLNWYLDSLQNYHDWQIATVRRVYPGLLVMLYPSWGVRPGQLDAAIAGDLSGATSPEKNGEIQRGFDFSRYIAGIRDKDVAVYSTWLDARASDADEASATPARWSPVHYLASLAQAHPLHLRVWGENTGQGDEAALRRCFAQMQAYHLSGFLWAFEKQLYDGKYATLDQFANLLAREEETISR